MYNTFSGHRRLADKERESERERPRPFFQNSLLSVLVNPFLGVCTLHYESRDKSHQDPFFQNSLLSVLFFRFHIKLPSLRVLLNPFLGASTLHFERRDKSHQNSSFKTSKLPSLCLPSPLHSIFCQPCLAFAQCSGSLLDY